MVTEGGQPRTPFEEFGFPPMEARAALLALGMLERGYDLMSRVMSPFEKVGWNRASADVDLFQHQSERTFDYRLEAGWLAWHIVHHDQELARHARAELDASEYTSGDQ